MRRRSRGGRRGVSDVIATILLLALTVTLFSSIFFFVNSLPRPPTQPSNQFIASLSYSGNQITFVNVQHLIGSVIPAAATTFYLTSGAKPGAFSGASFTLSQGMPGATSWSLGQTWSLNVTSYALTAPDNITVTIVNANQLLFRATVPGSLPNAPPIFTSFGTSPAQPTVGSSFVVYAQIADPNLRYYSVFVDTSRLPGSSGPSAHQMAYNSTSGRFTYTVPAAMNTAPGTFYVFVNATDTSSLKNSVAVSVTVVPLSGTSSFPVKLSLNNTAPVIGQPVTLLAQVGNPTNGTLSANLTFQAGATVLGSTAGPISSGASGLFTQAWTPSATGPTTATVSVALGGAMTGAASVSLTVFPKILLVAHNVANGNNTNYNESALLAQELSAAGFPFSSVYLPCASSLTSGLFTGYSIAIVDYGSATGSGACTAISGISSTDQSVVVSASSSVHFWIVGARAFLATACASYSSAFMAVFGIGYNSGSTCVTRATGTTTSVTFNSANVANLRSDGPVGSLTLNKTIVSLPASPTAAITAFQPYDTFTRGLTATGNAWLSAGSSVIGTLVTGASAQAALATDPALLTSPIPDGSAHAWGTGTAGTAVVYDLMNYLCGFSTSSSSGRGLPDFGIAGAVGVGFSHSLTTHLYVAVRANGPSAGTLLVSLLVNGAPATYRGYAVSALVAIASGNGNATYAALSWVAPAAGSYTLSFSIVSQSGPDLYPLDDTAAFYLLGQAISFA